ncbi:MAG: hypothetical protein IPK14_01920 [Blastocatellia bacterium]|nr:hypothetical protein [Blastocatellia bacterium]MBL8192961.1 hypothetical protein [Blastocatellia bacterium]MBN8721650.1 hypothetical protein [Acidobacteriota bacterium]
MRIDRTWTISFEDNEKRLLLEEIELVEMPSELGWKSLLKQVVTNRQITLPLRAIERLSLELDITRSQFSKRRPHHDYSRQFPQIAALTLEIDTILYISKRKSA